MLKIKGIIYQMKRSDEIMGIKISGTLIKLKHFDRTKLHIKVSSFISVWAKLHSTEYELKFTKNE